MLLRRVAGMTVALACCRACLPGVAAENTPFETFIFLVILALAGLALVLWVILADVVIAALYVFAVDDTVGEPSDRAVFELAFR